MKDIIFKTLMLKGEAGSTIVSMERTGHSGTTDTYTITFDDGSTTDIHVENLSSVESIELTSQTDTEDTYTATLADGSTQSFSVLNHNADIEAISEELAAGLASIQAALDDQSALLNARMDTFTSLPSGSTAGDAELMDIRVGEDGTTYESAGSAVRGQISDLKSDIDMLRTHTRNIFEGNVVQGNIVAGNDSSDTAAYYVRCNTKIPVLPNTTYTLSFISKANKIMPYYYESSGVYQQYDQVTYGSEGTLTRRTFSFTTPANTGFLRFKAFGSSGGQTYTPTDFSQIQLEVGTTATEYIEPYEANDPVAREAISILDASTNNNFERIGAMNLNLFDSSNLENGVYYAGGVRQTDSGHSASDYIDIVGGGTYCCARYVNGEKSNIIPIIEWYDANKAYIDWTSSANPVTFPTNANYCRISAPTALISGQQFVFFKADSLSDMPDEWVPYSVDITDLQMNKVPKWEYACGNIICIGDSLTDGLYADTTKGLIKQNYPYYLKRMLSAEVVNAGKNGYAPENWFNTQFSLYDYTDYDAAIIWLGTNGGLDSDYNTEGTLSNYYKKIIDGIIAQNSDIEIVLCTVFTTGRYHDDVPAINVSTTNSTINTLAETYGCCVIDMSDLAYSNHPELHNNISNTHFGKAGNIFIADRVCNELKSYFSANPLRCEFGIMPKE